ncbi:MAG TPA: magnesium-translocating P-type ATPase [Pyrinomonadaceae bacterium]|nr:magnesium-translocating P-type ATPase [Pyrinomonadaceae bacterium]
MLGRFSQLENTALRIEAIDNYWNIPVAELLVGLGSSASGLTVAEARRRFRLFGPNRLKPDIRFKSLRLLVRQFQSPLILILLGAAALSFFLREPIDALIVISIVLLSSVLGFWQEKRAADAVNNLIAIVQLRVAVLRDGLEQEIPAEEIVKGDVCVLNAGDIIPGDATILTAKDLFVDEAILTGESYPAEKQVGELSKDTPLMKRTNVLFMGTHVISGSAHALVIATGAESEFGKISERLRRKSPETEFEHGVRRFGYLLTEVTLILVLVIFGVTVYLHRPLIDSFLFALAIAVGIIPELLPAIISINLAVGAVHMARRKVIVKQLASIENLGSMNLLCVDKTGTLTEGAVKLQTVIDAAEAKSEKGLLYAYLNASFETGFVNPLDHAIRTATQLDITDYEKLDEIPYDFLRKRLSILVAKDGERVMITKGAVGSVLDICSSAEFRSGSRPIAEARDQIERQSERLGHEGLRTLGVAYKKLDRIERITKTDETEMTFLALLVFSDPTKVGVAEALSELHKLGISVKIITGDNAHVATSVARSVLGYEPAVLKANELKLLSSDALRSRVNSIDVFAEIEPNQKERIVLALKKAGNRVGFLGDGINDAAALHAADVGISVNTAVDVAKEAASLVLLEKDLGVLTAGVCEGRKTFANTLKYIYMTTSANFGNMFSMAGAALFLPFLPLLPKQILLNNFLTDFPAMAISTDTVDAAAVENPQPWDVGFIRNFMIIFGIVSSLFDFLTFAVLIFLFNANAEQFRTAWFVESVMTEVVIIVVMRTAKPFYKSSPSKPLMWAMIGVLIFTLILPYSPLNALLGLTALSSSWLFVLVLITCLYVAASELAKRLLYSRVFSHPRAVDGLA